MTRSELAHHVESFRNQGGEVRCFERADGGSEEAVRLFLARRGYHLTKKNGLFRIKSAGVTNPKRRTWKDVVTFVDEIRTREGKITLRRQA